MSRLPVPGDDADIWGDVLNDFLSVAHQTDGSLKAGAVQVADGSITPAKLSQSYVAVAEKGATNGVASLDSSGKVPVGQLPPGAVAGDATTSAKGIIQLAGDLGGTSASPTVPGLSSKASDASVIHLAGTETITGAKTFSVSPTVPGPSVGSDAANKTYVDSTVAGLSAPDATTSSKGIIQLAGDLAGTAAAPTVPGLANKVNTNLLGVANGVATLNAGGQLTGSQAPLQLLPYSMSGSVSVTLGAIRLYNYSGANWTIIGVSASVGTPPTGASIIIDVKVSNTTIFTTQANRPTIAAGANNSGHVTNMNVTTVANGAYLTVDVAQVGSTIAGSDLCVQVEVR